MAPLLPSTQQQHFKNVFWSQKQPELTLPDFQTGLSVLHQKLGQSKIENEELISYFKERISIEEYYAHKLADQSKTPLKSAGFGRDEGAGLVKSFLQLKETSRQYGEHHKATAITLTHNVLEPLQAFHDDYKHTVSSSKQAMEGMLKQFDGLVKEAERSRSGYHRKCRDADKAEEVAVNNAAAAELLNSSKTEKEESISTPHQVDKKENTPASGVASNDKSSISLPTSKGVDSKESTETASTLTSNGKSSSKSTNIQLGNQVMPHSELDELVRRMRKEIPIGDHRVPILGTYKNTSSGEDIAIWLQHNLPQCKDSPAMADIVGQQLIQPYHVLRLIGQRGSKFTASVNCMYQWQRTGEESLYEDGSSLIANDTTSTATHPDSNNSGGVGHYGGLSGLLLDKIAPAMTSATASMSEEPHKRARREAEQSDQAYRASVLKLNQMRMAIEEAMFAHLSEMEHVELHRIQTIKSILAAFTASLSETIPQNKRVIEEMSVYLESLKPNQDIEYIVQQYAISGFSPKAIVYDNYYHGIVHDQVFGIPLEDPSVGKQQMPPQFISFILKAIERGTSKIEETEKKTLVWSTPCALDHVHAACLELDTGNDQLTLEMFEKYEPDLLVAVLRYFLLELPDCLLTYEFYDPVHALMKEGNAIHGQDDSKLRLTSISNLIATLPSAHFNTLNAILKSITSFIKETAASTDTIEDISHSLGPVILRARVESFSTLNSKVPSKLAHELITQYGEIFTETTLKLHSESEKRRQAKPIIASTTAAENDKATMYTSKRSNSSGLMSFMRPTINTTEELSSKWRIMFQKHTTANSPQSAGTPSPSSAASESGQQSPSIKSIPLAFGSIITRQNSPPPRSSLSPSNISHNTRDATHTKDNTAGTTPETEKVAAQPPSPTIMFDADRHMKETDTEIDSNSMSPPKKLQSSKGDKLSQIDASFFDDDEDEDNEAMS